MALPRHLTDFFEGRPALKVIKRSDQEFDATKQVFIESPDVPLVIVRPQTAEQVAELVGHLSANSTPLVIRAGGHDLSTRSVAQDAVQIDLRDLNTVQVAEDKRTARIGGGILTQGLLDGLAAEGVMTACGNAGTVGWCSWAMNGGYGIMVAKYGLGCDQIVGARVVLADGRIVVADERLLKALRGAGPAFGVIVELEIKVYPLTEITGGFITCDITDGIGSSLTKYFDNCKSLFNLVESLPRELYFQPMIMTPPGAPSAVWGVQFVWAGPASTEQAEWLEKVVSISPGGQAAVSSVALADYVRQLTQMIAPHLQGGETRTVSLRSLVPSPGAVAVIAKHAPLITPDWGAMFIHMVHGQPFSPDHDHPARVFPTREVHLMVEILGYAFTDAESKPAAASWCRTTHEALKSVDGVMDEAYLPLMQSSILSLERTFKKADLEFLRGLKREFDPDNVFFKPMPLSL